MYVCIYIRIYKVATAFYTFQEALFRHALSLVIRICICMYVHTDMYIHIYGDIDGDASQKLTLN
jgi:hypothetical protein